MTWNHLDGDHLGAVSVQVIVAPSWSNQPAHEVISENFFPMDFNV